MRLNLTKLSLNQKVAIVIAALAMGNISIAWVGLSRMSSQQDTLNRIVNVHSKRIRNLIDARAIMNEYVIASKNYLLSETSQERDKFKNQLQETGTKFLQELESIASQSPQEDRADFTAVSDSFKNYSSTIDSTSRFIEAGKLKEAVTLSQSIAADQRQETMKAIRTVLDLQSTKMERAVQSGSDLYLSARRTMILVSLISVIAGLLLAVLTLRSISDSIHQVINALKASSSRLMDSARTVTGTSMKISQATVQQASIVQETASAIEQTSSMVSKNSESAAQASQVSKQSQQNALRGKTVINDMIQSIQEIDESNNRIMAQIDQSNQQLSEIVRVISEIGTKTQVINDIVFQTKLLSFNASVEAARAGEHGKGFAVVAEEVGNLAQMSGNAARDITSMLESSIQKVQTIVDETKTQVNLLVAEGKSKVSHGSEVAQQCGTVLDQIVTDVNSLTEMAASIASASREQAHGVQTIKTAMSQLDQSTQINASSSKDAASSANSLSIEAGTLNDTVKALIEAIYSSQKTERKFEAPALAPAAAPAKAALEAPKAKVIPLPVPVKKAEKPVEVPAQQKPAQEKQAKKTPKKAQEKVESKEVTPSSAPMLRTAGAKTNEKIPSPDDPRFRDL